MIEYKVDWPVQLRIANYNCCAVQDAFSHNWNIMSYYRKTRISNTHEVINGGNGILLPKLFWPTVRKNCSINREKLLKFEAEGREFPNSWDH